MNTRVLVTGGSGVIGRQVIGWLNDTDFEVWAVSRDGTVRGADRVVKCDLLDPSSRRAALRQARATHLVHLAWHERPDRLHAPENLKWAAATLDLFAEFAGFGGKRAVAAGSCAEYDWSYELLSEKTPLRPDTLYGQAKACTGRLLGDGAGVLGISLAWARIFYCYGPGAPRGSLLGDLIYGLLEGTPIPCTDGRQERDYLHAADVAGAIGTVLQSDLQGPVNIGSGRMTEVRDLIMALADLAGRPDLVRLSALPRPDMEPPRLLADIRKLASTGFVPTFDLKRGLHDCLRQSGYVET